MGRKKRRWRKAKARQQSPGIGRLVAWAEWEEEKGGETDAKENACPAGQATS